MKKILVIALIAAWGSLALGASGSLAATHHHAHVAKTLVVGMRDPGCHWFVMHGKYLKTASINGPVRLVDQDEASLKVVSRHTVRIDKLGSKGLVLKRGHYVVMMVGQATDDNYLKLTVR